ncbi:MAG: type II secretion system major pseudopilin GspG [Candidatus Poribacteria bacterium]|nr:type II secretion system major pseudopilin GspG [Candidatus Poribacteria bacterium]
MATKLLKMLRQRNEGDEGFTLVEVLVVLTIIGILAATVSPVVIKRIDEGRQQTAKSQLKTFKTALEMYALDVGVYPTTEEGLEALTAAPTSAAGWKGPYLQADSVNQDGSLKGDPWNNELIYTQNDGSNPMRPYELFSYGKDGEEGGTSWSSDISVWDGVLDEEAQQ